ncbi:MAG: TatD family hydrolase, partial [Candidatus Aminicenantes bacterium]|nr:TatD family hydrolase [Candidatus Aminicenantes bacterium]
PDAQREAFLAQIDLAQAAGKPIVIHSRKAEDEICSILERTYPSGAGLNGVVHCFTSDEPTARRCLDRGFFIGLGGILTFRKSDSLRALASRLPLDRILIETDSPYLAPVPFRGKTNEPARVVEVARELGRVRALTLEQVGENTRANFERLFGAGSHREPGRLAVSN